MDEHNLERERSETLVSEVEQIDLFRLLEAFWKAVRRLFWIPVALAVLGCALLTARAWWSYTPMYQSEVTFTIQTSGTGSLGDIGSGNTYYDKAAAEQLTKTFPYLIGSELLQTMLRQELGVEALNGSVTAHTVENTNLFSLVATSADPQAAYDMLTAVMQVYPKVADYVIGSTEMYLLTEPVVAAEPYNDLSLLRPAAKGAILGCVLGLAVLLLYAATRKSIQDPREVRSQLNQVCLGTVPQVAFKRRSKETEPLLSIQNDKVSGAFQESIRRLRMKLQRETEGQTAQVLMVTSTLPGEGKTTVAANLALSLSQTGARVILVDLDLRNPSVKKNLGLSARSQGMGHLLTQGGSAGDCLLHVEGSELRLLADDGPTGSLRTKGDARRLKTVLEELRGEADYIILDTPPSGLLADSGTVARLADGTLYVIRSGVPQVSHILDVFQFLGESGTKVVGCVLNGVRGSRSSYGYYGYGYGYPSGYGGYGRKESGRKSRDRNE